MFAFCWVSISTYLDVYIMFILILSLLSLSTPSRLPHCFFYQTSSARMLMQLAPRDQIIQNKSSNVSLTRACPSREREQSDLNITFQEGPMQISVHFWCTLLHRTAKPFLLYRSVRSKRLPLLHLMMDRLIFGKLVDY